MADPNKTISDNNDLLEEINSDKIKEYVPVIAYVAIVIVLGVVGNVMTVIFYGSKTRRSTNSIIIVSLAAIDLTTCVIFSDEIVKLCFSITFKNAELCRFIYFLNHWSVGSSVFVLWVICIDRYRKICRHFSWQFTKTSVGRTIIAVCAVALVVSVPNTLMRGIVRVNVTDTHGNMTRGYHCTRSDDEQFKTAFTVLYVIDLIILLVIIVTFVFLYSLIIKEIISTRRNTKKYVRQSHSISFSSHRSLSRDSVTNTSVDMIVGDGHELEGIDNNVFTKIETVLPGNAIQRNTSRSCENIHAETRITLIMVAITIGYIVSFTPYFIVNLAIRPNTETSDEFSAEMQLALRSYMLNSAMNPYIIGAFNPVFRKFVIRILCGYFFRSSSNPEAPSLEEKPHAK